jgi:hypothetical protein
MKHDIHKRKAIVRWSLGIILVADGVLAGANWRIARSPHVPAGELVRLQLLEKSYRADNARLEKFRTELPSDEKQWDEFYTTHFRPSVTGYSGISADLGELSRSAGLTMGTVTFHQYPPDSHGLMQVDIGTGVEGDYDSLLRFLDKLEHSQNFYVLDSLALASNSAGHLRLNLQLRTYFRT